ncbi:MAG: DUF465 domain-containing protein [Sulfuriflexus sp.]|nr:DUF465 domain-containing protein [Sulfuriflexus sp.]
MLVEHYLVDEMPEYRDKIHQLKQVNHSFTELYNEYVEVDNTIHRIEERVETELDDYTETLKTQRVLLKDQLYDMLKMA